MKTREACEIEIEDEPSEDSQDSDKDDSCGEDECESDNNSVNEDRTPHKTFSNDIVEGKTVFVKNVPFMATDEDFKQTMRQYGPVYYALICRDKLTDHSKGTAFVKFVNKEDAEKALSAGTELTLLGNILDCMLAKSKDELNKVADDKNKGSKDSRNLYLVKEGVILAGTEAAQGVSASDMAKRLQIEQYKTQMLRNLNMFVSPDRLVVHNLPATWDDKKLRALVEKYGGKGAIVKEARVMRDMKNVDANGIGRSKEFGFVAFVRHENALHCLRALNNNPNIFNPGKRPIITFSIENKKAMFVKQKRLEKSKQKNPVCSNYKLEQGQKGNNRSAGKRKAKTEDQAEDVEKFAGVTAKPGIPKLKSRYQLKVQAKIHYETLKKEKKQLKSKKLLSSARQNPTKQPKQKINKKFPVDNFSKLVNQYREKLTESLNVPKKKWFEQ